MSFVLRISNAECFVPKLEFGRICRLPVFYCPEMSSKLQLFPRFCLGARASLHYAPLCQHCALQSAHRSEHTYFLRILCLLRCVAMHFVRKPKFPQNVVSSQMFCQDCLCSAVSAQPCLIVEPDCSVKLACVASIVCYSHVCLIWLYYNR